MKQIEELKAHKANIRSSIQLMLDISTAHIPERTAKLLDWQDIDVEPCPVNEDPAPASLWQYVTYTKWGSYGWIFYVSEDQANSAQECGHPELAQLIRHACQAKIDYLKLDRDADQLEGLPVFEW